MMNRACRRSPRRMRSASRPPPPPTPGIAKSATIRSGCSRLAVSNSSLPLATAATSSTSGGSRWASPSRNMAWSSANTRRALGMRPPGEWNDSAECRAAGRAVYGQPPADRRDALGGGAQAQAGGLAGRRGIEAAPVIGDSESELGPLDTQQDVHLARPRMANHVVECLLHHPVDAESDNRGNVREIVVQQRHLEIGGLADLLADELEGGGEARVLQRRRVQLMGDLAQRARDGAGLLLQLHNR